MESIEEFSASYIDQYEDTNEQSPGQFQNMIANHDIIELKKIISQKDWFH